MVLAYKRFRGSKIVFTMGTPILTSQNRPNFGGGACPSYGTIYDTQKERCQDDGSLHEALVHAVIVSIIFFHHELN